MDHTERSSTQTAESSASQSRLDQPLPPFPPNTQEDGPTVDPREIMYRGYGETSARGSNDYGEQNESSRQARHMENHGELYQQISASRLRSSSSTTTASTGSRSRGSSSSQAHSEDDSVNVEGSARSNRAFASQDRPELHRASSSASSRQSMHSALSSHSNDASNTSRDPPTRQSRYRRSPSGRSEFVVPRWQPDNEATYCPICNSQFSKSDLLCC